MDDARRRYLHRLVRGRETRPALRAVGELHRSGRADAWDGLDRAPPRDDVRALHLRVAQIVRMDGPAGLAAHWDELGGPDVKHSVLHGIFEWNAREHWLPEAIEVGVRALEDATHTTWEAPPGVLHRYEVRMRASLLLFDTVAGRRELLDGEPLRGRAVRSLLAMIVQRGERPPTEAVRLLGLVGRPDDPGVIESLEALRPEAGDTHTVHLSFGEEYRPDWRTRLVAERKGVRPAGRIEYRGAGRLDRVALQDALDAIRSRG